MSSKELKDAINDLGRFFGIRQADSYLQAVLDPTSIPMATDPLAMTDLSLRGELLNAITGGGDSAPSVQAILRYIETAIGPGIDDPATGEKVQTMLEEINSDICITPFSPGVWPTWGGPDVTKHPLNAPGVTVPGPHLDETQGLFLPEKVPKGDHYSIADFRSLDFESGKPVPVHVIQVFPSVGNVAQSDTDVVSLFLGSVPTLELSRAVPYIDVMVIAKHGGGDTKTRRLSVGRFLLGEDMSSEPPEKKEGKSLSQGIFSSEDVSVIVEEGDEANAYRTSANMEIFTSPQTMIPTDADGTPRMYSDNDATGDTKSRDPFQPLLSLESFNLNVVGTGGINSYKSGDMKVTLHDKAMLGAVTPMVAPQEMGSGGVHLVITYGWAHPDGAHQSSGRPADADNNRWGDMINSMRVTETYSVVNSDFSFEDNGSVGINMKLAMLGAANVDGLDITLPLVATKSGETDQIFGQIKEALKSYTKRQKSVGKINIPTTLRSATNMRSASAMKAEDRDKLKKWLSERQSDPDLTDIHTYIQTIFGDGESTPGSLADVKDTLSRAINDMCIRLQYTPDPFFRPVGDAIWDVCQVEGKKADFFEGHKAQMGSPDEAREKGSRVRYASLGKILTFFVGETLATESRFNEVQLIFYPFNSDSSFLFDCNTAQFPIPLYDFTEMLKEKFSVSGRMSISQFTGFLNTYFLRDQGAPGFGFSSLYANTGFAGRDPEKRTRRQFEKSLMEGKGKDSKPAQTKINNKKKGIIANAYGLEKNDPGSTFKMPQISIRMESVPMRDDFLGRAEDKMMLKIHVIDQKCSSTSTLADLFDGFAGSGFFSSPKREQFGINTGARGSRHAEVSTNQLEILASPDMDAIEKADMADFAADVSTAGYTEAQFKALSQGMYRIKMSNPDQLKNVLMQLSPTLIHGTLNSSIISAKVSSQNDPALATANMMAHIKKTDGSQAGEDDGLPQQIMPTTLDIECLGCPYFSYGQQYFVDMGSNTTADNFYGVFGVDHKLSSAGFTTSVKLTTMQAFGKWTSTMDQIKDMAVHAVQAESDQKST